MRWRRAVGYDLSTRRRSSPPPQPSTKRRLTDRAAPYPGDPSERLDAVLESAGFRAASSHRLSHVRSKFVARLGPNLADTIETAVAAPCPGVPGQIERGSDDFRWALVWAVGFECLTRPGFRREHGVTAPWADLCCWIADEADLANVDGTMDWSGRGAGRFDLILGRRSAADEEAGWEGADALLLSTMPIEATACPRASNLDTVPPSHMFLLWTPSACSCT